MEHQSAHTMAALAAMSLKNSREPSKAGDDGDSDDLSEDLSEDLADMPPPPMKATIFRRKNSDPSQLNKLGVNLLTYYPKQNLFVAHPIDSPTTPALVAKAPVPENGEG